MTFEFCLDLLLQAGVLSAMAVSSDVGLGSVLQRLSKPAPACFLTRVVSNNQSPSCSTHLDEADFSWSPCTCLWLSIYLFIGSMSEKVDTASHFFCHCRNFFRLSVFSFQTSTGLGILGKNCHLYGHDIQTMTDK